MSGGRAWHALIIAMSILQATPPVWACSCEGPRGRKILLAHPAVFAGKATKIHYLAPVEEYTEPPIVVTFEVYQVWKGPIRRTAVLRTVYNKRSCNGYYFKEGQDYLLAADRVTRDDEGEGRYELEGIHLCGGTRLLSRAQEDLAELGSGTKPS